jgi:hypothetical protein|nr:MAG TPA: hypothetical protein [Caudoviricetes sp.]
MDNIVSAKLDSRYASTLGVWQYDYGQVLRITGPELPLAVEVQFSLDEKSGETLSRVGTTVDGVTEVKIPDELLTHSATSNYRIYAYIYLTDETSGSTKYEIIIPVRVRSKPTSPAEDPETDPDLFRETVVAVNASAERAENAASSAMESAASADETLAEIKRVADGISGNIENANTMKTELSDMINNAGIEKKELESSIGKAGEAKRALDSSIRSAGEKQLALDTTVEHANTVDASLKEHIGSAEQIQANVEQIATNKEDIGSLKEDLSNKITKFYASNQGETHLADSDNGKIMDMMLYGRSEQKKYKGINLIPPNIKYGDFVEVSIPKETKVFAITDGTKFSGGNFLFFNADKTKSEWFGLDKDTTISTRTLTIDAKYVQNLLEPGLDVSKICLGIGNEPIYEPYVGGQQSPSPGYPQEIKRVVNPTMKVCGKNLWDNFKTLSLGNVEQKNGTYIATADTMQVDITSSSIGARPLLLKANNAYTFSLKTTVSISSPKFVCLRYTNGESNNIIFTNKNFVNFVPERDVEKIGFILYESVAGDKAYDVQLEMGSEATAYEPYTEQSVQLPYTLNAIPVASGGNVTIDGQQYIADYVDVERGKVVRMCGKEALNTKNGEINEEYRLAIRLDTPAGKDGGKECIFSTFKWSNWTTCVSGTSLYIKNIKKPNNELYTAQELKELSIDFDVIYQLLEQQETDLTPEQTQALKELVTYYPVTNISVNSDQLDGYTVFNYPISMANGWNYVKQQLGDTRDYIYDMDAKAQDIDIQSAEAYVNSEYAVALTELEV